MAKQNLFSALIPLALALCLAAAPVSALSENAGTLILSATVEPAAEIALKAPASGELAAFSVKSGDCVQKGSALFSVEPKRVYAEVNGTVAIVYAQKGDSADAAMTRYGAVMQIDYEDRYVLRCVNSSAYNSAENRDLYVGAPVYLRAANERSFADGVITAVSGKSFTVQVLGGDLVFTQDIKVYREPDYSSRSLLARAKLESVPPYAVAASGAVTDMAVRRGDAVRAGDYLFSYVPDALEPSLLQLASPTAVTADAEWIVLDVQVKQGASVQKGQLLATVCALGDYRLQASVEESDLRRVAVGDRMTVRYEESGAPDTVATVTSIGALGSGGDVSSYAVYLAPEHTRGALPGMHATVEKP